LFLFLFLSDLFFMFFCCFPLLHYTFNVDSRNQLLIGSRLRQNAPFCLMAADIGWADSLIVLGSPSAR